MQFKFKSVFVQLHRQTHSYLNGKTGRKQDLLIQKKKKEKFTFFLKSSIVCEQCKECINLYRTHQKKKKKKRKEYKQLLV